VVSTGAYLVSALSDLSARFGLGEVRGRGLLVALDLKQDIAPKIVDLARDAGLLVNAPRPNLLRFMPSLTVSKEEIDMMMAMLANMLPRATAS
jgi:acetylornithine/N-succinyldiaminopimelate aminotransferase